MSFWNENITNPSVLIKLVSVTTSVPPISNLKLKNGGKNSFVTSATCTANSLVGRMTTAPVYSKNKKVTTVPNSDL